MTPGRYDSMVVAGEGYTSGGVTSSGNAEIVVEAE